MGKELADLSGIDPFTVNQYVMVEHDLPELEHWAYGIADEKGWTKAGPVLLENSQGEFWSTYPGMIDAYLFHPRTQLVEGRPDWMSMGGLRRPVRVEVAAAAVPTLLQARFADESDDAVPADQIVLWPERPVPALFLRPGTYRLRLIDRNDRVLRQDRLVVGREPE